MPTRKQRGYDTQSLVAGALANDGFPWALPTGAGRSGSDITNTPGICWEVKARREFNPMAAMRQVVTNAGENLPVVVIRPDGAGPVSIDYWPLILPFGHGRRLLRLAGYGEPLTDPVPGVRGVS